MTVVIILIIILLTLAFFYLKCSLMQSLTMLWAAVLATIIVFSFYEGLANQFLSRGYAMDWALFICFMVSYIVSFGAIRVGLDFLIPAGIDLGKTAKLSAALICGLLTGVIFAGNLLVGLGLMPKQGKLFYSRFDSARPPVLAQQKIPPLNADGFVTGLYSWISSGSMSSGKSFSALHADYLSQIHLNKLKAPNVLTVTGPDAIEVPSGKNLKPVRYVQDREGRRYTIIRAGITKKDVASQNIQFFPGQIRLIAVASPVAARPFIGSATAVYPAGFWKDGALQKTELSDLFTADSFQSEGPRMWLDVAFEASDRLAPVLLEFKQNAISDLSSFEVVENTPEIETALEEYQSAQAEGT